MKIVKTQYLSDTTTTTDTRVFTMEDLAALPEAGSLELTLCAAEDFMSGTEDINPEKLSDNERMEIFDGFNMILFDKECIENAINDPQSEYANILRAIAHTHSKVMTESWSKIEPPESLIELFSGMNTSSPEVKAFLYVYTMFDKKYKIHKVIGVFNQFVGENAQQSIQQVYQGVKSVYTLDRNAPDELKAELEAKSKEAAESIIKYIDYNTRLITVNELLVDKKTLRAIIKNNGPASLFNSALTLGTRSLKPYNPSFLHLKDTHEQLVRSLGNESEDETRISKLMYRFISQCIPALALRDIQNRLPEDQRNSNFKVIYFTSPNIKQNHMFQIGRDLAKLGMLVDRNVRNFTGFIARNLLRLGTQNLELFTPEMIQLIREVSRTTMFTWRGNLVDSVEEYSKHRVGGAPDLPEIVVGMMDASAIQKIIASVKIYMALRHLDKRAWRDWKKGNVRQATKETSDLAKWALPEYIAVGNFPFPSIYAQAVREGVTYTEQ